ncbi:hypothetical protein B0I35DRAFT_405706 [Stachybotrys elegans]|uniref:DUF1750-domain-containing protein n=1 Tax=Stachybotrys elegans TaxID=80388 RepID=A0A8K0SYR6_9HYPO|nr:hypothetical protein B0I35DRAFT_405706 [Stachybotrys elegans]
MAHPDPSHSVPQELMPHVHLISSTRYPVMPQPNVNEIAKWLMAAPQVARDRAPFFWTYLDKPADGSIFLTWQPLGRLGTAFATDGFVWGPQEHLYKHDLGNGLMLEIYYQKSGYIQGEQFALHSRRRFRLVPVPGHPNPTQPDISLFIVHYGPSEHNDRLPVSSIPYDERTNASMQQRHFLMRAGQIRRKEFMLSDRVNWPSLPELTRQQLGPQVAPRGVPQQMAYPTQATPGPPAKRPRHAPVQNAPAPMQGMPALDAAFDDDEDTSRGDMFDNLTPREISYTRYLQNHEWMEEILSSPYRINQITPPDLGLGLKGELAALTEGIFIAQGGEAQSQVPDKGYVGRLDPGKAEEFRKRVDAHIESTKDEIEKMKAAHAEALAKFKSTSIFATKEKELRSLDNTRQEAKEGDEGVAHPTKDAVAVEEIVKQVEAATGLKISSAPIVNRIQAGGYQAPAPEPAAPTTANADMSRQGSQSGSQNSGIMIGESDVDMGGTAAGMLDQMHTGFSSTSTPNNYPTPQNQLAQSSSATPLHGNVPSPALPQQARTSHAGGDVSMGGTETASAGQMTMAPDQGSGTGDWVVVPKGGETSGTSTPALPANTSAISSAPPAPAGAPAHPEAEAARAAPAMAKPASAAATPAITEGGSYDQNDFSSLGDLDTAGDALAGYDGATLDGGAGELGEGLDLSMDMEDSAFGDAFHGVVASDTPGDGQGQDM